MAQAWGGGFHGHSRRAKIDGIVLLGKDLSSRAKPSLKAKSLKELDDLSFTLASFARVFDRSTQDSFQNTPSS